MEGQLKKTTSGKVQRREKGLFIFNITNQSRLILKRFIFCKNNLIGSSKSALKFYFSIMYINTSLVFENPFAYHSGEKKKEKQNFRWTKENEWILIFSKTGLEQSINLKMASEYHSLLSPSFPFYPSFSQRFHFLLQALEREWFREALNDFIISSFGCPRITY